ncbi:MAG: TetR/AcrR family transcriptional regulator [Bacteroidota bacterium]
MTDLQSPWVVQGYRTFALDGPARLKVERLAQEVGKNKSSFYHHFAELEVFKHHLLRYHLSQADIMAKKEANCQSHEELIDILLDHKLDLLFSRQLRVHRDNPDFLACFMKTNEITYQSFVRLWAQILGLEDDSYLAGLVLKLSLENLFLQITEQTLERSWLENYFSDIQGMVQAFKTHGWAQLSRR